MIRLMLLAIALLLINGCATGYPAWKYRCYKVEIKPEVEVPPMPNCRENNKSLIGIDADNDGVRDDLQRYIAALEIDHPYFIRGLTQYARALQKTMLEYNREDLAQRNFVRQNLANECAVLAIFPPQYSNGRVYEISNELRDLHLNTFNRRSAHKQWRSYLETQLVPGVGSQTACNFNSNELRGKRLQ